MKRSLWQAVVRDIRDDWVLLVLTLIALATIFLGADRPFSVAETAALIGLGVVYLLFLHFGFTRLESSRSPMLLVGVFGGLIVLFLVIAILARLSGAFWLLLGPVAYAGSMFLSRHWMIALSVLLVAVFALPIGIITGRWDTAWIGSLTFAPAVIFVVMVSQVLKRERQALSQVAELNAQLEEANRRLGEYAVQAEELAITRERNRLARDIHDTLGHFLTTINVQIEVARTLVEDGRPGAGEALDKAQALVRQALGEVRHSVQSLRASPTENRTLEQAIAELAASTRASGIVAHFNVLGEARPLSPQAEQTLYRAAQEGLTNARKYAFASAITLQLDYTRPDRVKVRVEDNGVGTDAAETGGGFGLLGLRERAQLLGGRVSVRTSPGQGLTLEVEVPA